MNKFILVSSIFISMSACAGEKEQAKQALAPKIEMGPRNTKIYVHPGNGGKGIKAHEFWTIKGYVYNDTPTPILFETRGGPLNIKPYEKALMPPIHQISSSAITDMLFKKNIKESPLHKSTLGEWLNPDIGDYAVIIKRDPSGVTDLGLEVVPKKELDALIQKHAQEIQQKVGTQIHESGINPRPIADIAASYVGTDVELPQE
jgi:hypothetical protein